MTSLTVPGNLPENEAELAALLDEFVKEARCKKDGRIAIPYDTRASSDGSDPHRQARGRHAYGVPLSDPAAIQGRR